MKKLLLVFALASVVILTACGRGSSSDTDKVIKSASVGNNLTVTLSNKNGALKHGGDEFTITFKDASGKPVDVGAVALSFYMPAMGTMAAMTNQSTFTTTNTPGIFQGKAVIETAGEWQVQISYEGPAGTGKTSFPITAQ